MNLEKGRDRDIETMIDKGTEIKRERKIER